MTIKEKLLSIYLQAPVAETARREVSEELSIYIDKEDLKTQQHADDMYIVYDYKNVKVRLHAEGESLYPYIDSVLAYYKSEYQRGYEDGLKACDD